MRKKNILFHAINGIGFGHIQRAKNLASFLLGQEYIGEMHLASSSKGEFDMGPFGSFHHLSEHISSDKYKEYEEQTYKEISEVILQNNIEVIFHDTYFISPLVKRREISHFYVYRATSLKHFRSVKKYVFYFSKIYVPHSKEEFETIIPLEEYEEFQDKIIFLGYVYDRSLEQIIQQKHKKKEKTIVISPGFGGDYEQVKDFFSYAINLVQKFIGNTQELYQVYSYLGIHKDKLCEDLDIPENFQTHGFSQAYKAHFVECDLFVGRGGYNTVSEIITLQKKSLLYFAERFHESQKTRIEFFANNCSFIELSTKDVIQDMQYLQALRNLSLSQENNLPIMKEGDIFYNSMINLINKPALCIFHSSYIQDSQVFIADEISELAIHFDIYIITFNKKFHSCSLYNNSITVVYFQFAHILYTLDKYPYVNMYTHQEEKVYKYFLKYMTQFLHENDIKYVLGEFLSDTIFIAPIKKITPKIKLFSCARGKDIYSTYIQSNKYQQNQLKQYIDGVFVRDNNMKKFTMEEGFNSNALHVIHSGKFIASYSFCYNDYSSLKVLIGGRLVEKKGILETLDFLEELGKRKNIKIESIILVGEEAITDKSYTNKVFKKISNSKYLSQKIEYRGFLWKQEFLTLLEDQVNVFIGHFQRSRDGDQDGIPNMITENMLIGNMVFSTLAGGIADILENDQTGYILRGNLKEDADVFEKIFIQKSQNDMNKINENARRYIEENCDIQKQVLSMKDIILKG